MIEPQEHGWLIELLYEDGNSTQLAVCFDLISGSPGFTNVAHEECCRFSRKIDADRAINYLLRIAIVPHRLKATGHQWD
jgi:hypothetical protein